LIGLNALFWMFVVLFAFIGATRGWAKEALVTFSVILAVFVSTVLENYVPVIGPIMQGDPKTAFLIKSGLIIILVFFGYQSPNFGRFASFADRFMRERLRDSILGFALGAVNAYLFVGTLLFYLHQAYTVLNGYPLPFIMPADSGSAIGQAYDALLKWMPPVWLNGIAIYIAVAVAFVFVLIVFL